MSRYVIARLLLFVPTLVGALTAIFFLLRVLPGDAALLVLVGPEGRANVDPEALAEVRRRLGTDLPIHEQYVRWIWEVAHGDLGSSLHTGRPVIAELAQRVPITLQIATASLLGAGLLGIPVGILMAVRQNSWVDHLLRIVTVLGLAAPSFFVATVVILLLVLWFGWYPPLGFVGFFEDPLANVQQVFWPVVILAYGGSVVTARITRSSMLEVMRHEYVVTARAKGIGERAVLVEHALRNAILPTVAFLGALYIFLLSGLVVIEKVFVIPGIGSGLVDSISQRDLPIVQGILLVLVLIVMTTNLLIDLLQAWVDPRISY